MPNLTKTPFLQIPSISQHFTGDFKGIEHLLPAEVLIVEKASTKRRADFSTGRYCASQALSPFIKSRPAILQGKGNEPLWPDGLVGSISHSKKLAGAVVAKQTDVTAIGVDIETLGGVKPDMWRLVFHDEEQALIRSKGNDAATWATLLFSLKESFYKLQYPLTGLFVDFTDILITESNAKLIFSNTNPQKQFFPFNLNRIETHWILIGDQLITLCYIRRHS
ncbi:MAG: 4'-phosphopantetheinyl transferase superfamily protein [Sphingobacteriaceae bacterium]|nr:MAG: 4'-phosphopantetheinyl transferase superfamily protein [Sphingobacteriaceae bacterium]